MRRRAVLHVQVPRVSIPRPVCHLGTTPLSNRRFTLSLSADVCLWFAWLALWCCCFDADAVLLRTVQQPPVVASAGRVRDAGALEQLPAHLQQLPQASLLLPGRQHRTAVVDALQPPYT